MYDVKTGALLVDKVDPKYGKDGYGIAVDEEHQRVFVANRDLRLNPPGEMTVRSPSPSVSGTSMPAGGPGRPGRSR